MPTASERAAREAEAWIHLAERWAGRPISEKDVIVFFDPEADLTKRASRWGHVMPGTDLSHLAAFAAALAGTEADGWEGDSREVATRAYEERRLLVGDRIIHWAVPWLDAHGETTDRDLLLEVGDEMRVAPRLAGDEGLRLEGEDSFGPRSLEVPLDQWTGSLLSGIVLREGHDDLEAAYRRAAATWETLARDHPGSAALWHDLTVRAAATAERLSRA